MTASDVLRPQGRARRDGVPYVIVVMPAYNAALTLADTAHQLPDVVDRVVLVDDASIDTTVDVAQRIGLHVVRHSQNRGYGGNQKTCYKTALALGADVVVMLHPDGQYDPTVIPDMVAPLIAGTADMVLGSRMMQPGGARAGGMPWWKRISNRALTSIENAVLGTRLSEAHTGYRAYTREFLMRVPWQENAEDFVFDTQIIFQAVALEQRILEVPVRTIYESTASSVGLRQSIVYGTKTLGVALSFALRRGR